MKCKGSSPNSIAHPSHGIQPLLQGGSCLFAFLLNHSEVRQTAINARIIHNDSSQKVFSKNESMVNNSWQTVGWSSSVKLSSAETLLVALWWIKVPLVDFPNVPSHVSPIFARRWREKKGKHKANLGLKHRWTHIQGLWIKLHRLCASSMHGCWYSICETRAVLTLLMQF